MSVSVQELVNKIGFEVDKRSVANAQRQAQFTAKSIRNTLLTTLGVIGGAAGLGMVAKAAVDATAKMEMLQAAWTTMLGDASKAETLLGKVERMAATTPFGLEQLADTGRLLLQFGAATEENVIDVMRDLGDVAQGNAQNMQSLSLAFAQATALGKLQAQDYRQMLNVGFNPLAVMAEKTGKSMSELSEAMSKGQISAADLRQALRWATSEGGQFYKSMENASKTFSGLMSTMRDDLQAVFRVLGKQFIEPLKNIVRQTSKLLQGGLTDIATGFGKIIAPVASMVETLFKVVVSVVEHVWGELSDGVDGMAESWDAMAERFAQWADEQMPRILETVDGIINAMSALAAVVRGVAGTFLALITILRNSPFGIVIEGIGQLTQAVFGVGQAFETMSLIVGGVVVVAMRKLVLVWAAYNEKVKLAIWYAKEWVLETIRGMKAGKGFLAVLRATTAQLWKQAVALLATLGPIGAVLAALGSLYWAYKRITGAVEKWNNARKAENELTLYQARLEANVAKQKQWQEILRRAEESGNEARAQSARNVLDQLAKERQFFSDELTRLHNAVSKAHSEMEDGFQFSVDPHAFDAQLQKLQDLGKVAQDTGKEINAMTNISVNVGGSTSSAEEIGRAIRSAFSLEFRKVLAQTM